MEIPEKEIPQEEIPEQDCIDDALLNLVHEVFGDDYDDDELDRALDVILSILDELIDSDEATELPEHEEPEEVKKEWINQFYDKLKQAVIEGVTLEEPDAESDESNSNLE